MGALQQSVPQNGRVHLHILDLSEVKEFQDFRVEPVQFGCPEQKETHRRRECSLGFGRGEKHTFNLTKKTAPFSTDFGRFATRRRGREAREPFSRFFFGLRAERPK